MPASSSGIFSRKASLFRKATSPPATVDEDSASQIPILQQSHHRRESSLLSLTNSVSDIGHNVRRSVSLRSHRSQHSGSFTHKARYPSSGTHIPSSLSPSPTHTATYPPPRPPGSRGKLSVSGRPFSQKTKSFENVHNVGPTILDGVDDRPPLTAVEPPKTPFSMLVAPFGSHGLKRQESERPSLASQPSFIREVPPTRDGAQSQHAPSVQTVTSTGGQNPHAVYQQIHDTSAKRMATIDYLRKVHEGNLYYLSTLHYTPAQIASLPSQHAYKLGRRATNYLLLGYSLPALLDLNSGSPLEYLKALSALMQEFETYQSLSPNDGFSSLSRGRVGQMFKHSMGLGKGRRASTATDSLAIDTNMLSLPTSASSASSPQDIPSPVNYSGHEFQHLLTPHLPFDPDFGTTFATLCDTLIDTYANLLNLVTGPEVCGLAVGEAFAKADKAVRKILVANVMREFEDSTRAGIKGEVAGLGKVVLGGLM